LRLLSSFSAPAAVSDMRSKSGSIGMSFTLSFRRGSFKLSEEHASLAEAVARARALSRSGEGMHFHIRTAGKSVLSDFEMEMKLREKK
jgi:hypothetical protein